LLAISAASSARATGRIASGEASVEEIMAYVAQRVAPHKRIHAVQFVDAIPKSPTGKTLRRVLAERDRQAG
jgi:acyl-coenzyme A synthetase/AMP-(fatty) acid ligase